MIENHFQMMIKNVIFFRPVEDATEPVIVQVSLNMNQILKLDAKSQILTTAIWKRLVSVYSVKRCCKKRFTTGIATKKMTHLH